MQIFFLPIPISYFNFLVCCSSDLMVSRYAFSTGEIVLFCHVEWLFGNPE